MRILCLSDQICPALWEHFRPELLEGIDLILSCGDLPAEYLSFLVTMARAPLLYVHGNHDQGYQEAPPEGCDCIDGKLVTVKGVHILGLGGSMRYREGPFQYTEGEMTRRILRLSPRLRRWGVDLVVTHAPPLGYGDGNDLPHRGFRAFNRLMEKYKPSYLIHGHVHLNYGWGRRRQWTVGDTTVLNAFERYVLEL